MKDITFRNSMKYGDLTTKLSLLILGLGNFRGRQIIKGILYIALEAAFIIFMIITIAITIAVITVAIVPYLSFLVYLASFFSLVLILIITSLYKAAALAPASFL